MCSQIIERERMELYARRKCETLSGKMISCRVIKMHCYIQTCFTPRPINGALN